MLQLICFFVLEASASEEIPIIDDYTFIWNIGEVGGYQIELRASEDGIYYYFSHLFVNLSATPTEVEKFAEILKSLKKIHNKVDKGEVVEEKIGRRLFQAEKHSEKGFQVIFTESGMFPTDRLVLSRGEARKLSSILGEPLKKANFLRKRLDQFFN